MDDLINKIVESQATQTSWTVQSLDYNLTKVLQLPRYYPEGGSRDTTILTICTFLEILGSVVTLLPLNLTLLLLTNHLTSFTFYCNTLLAQLYDSTIKILLKAAVGRERPDPADNGLLGISNYSFPSGHSCRVAMLGYLLLASRDEWQAGVVVMVTLGVAMVSISRVVTGRHYLSDVLGGMVVGLVNGAVWVHCGWFGEASVSGLFNGKLRLFEWVEGSFE